jgi:RHS repeat-associated protein
MKTTPWILASLVAISTAANADTPAAKPWPSTSRSLIAAPRAAATTTATTTATAPAPAPRFAPHSLGADAATRHRLIPQVNDAGDWSSGLYAYDAAGDITAIGTDAYEYDAVGRITRAALGPDYQTFEYDEFGNITALRTFGSLPNAVIPGVQPNTNRMSRLASGITTVGTYDASGNMTTLNNTYTYTFDPLDMMSELKAGSRDDVYLYDAGNERVATVSVNPRGGSYHYTIRGLDENVLREVTDGVLDTNHVWGWSKDYVYRGNSLLAETNTSTGGELQLHFHLDHLGSPRMITDGSTAARVAFHSYWPFGGDGPGSDADGERMKFTGHERDLAGGDVNALDYMHARYYTSSVGRFLSIDQIPSWRVSAPQSWNRFAYALNNPERYRDPNGLAAWDVISGIGAGICSFGEHTYEGLKGAVQHPSTLITGTKESLQTAGHAYFTSAGRAEMSSSFNSLSTKEKTAVITEAITTGVVAALGPKVIGAVGRAVAGGSSVAAASTTTVVHFTNDAGMQAISTAGELNAGTFVTLTSEIPAGATGSAVENLLEIAPGKGANSIAFETPTSNLTTPANGATTSGGATQFTLVEPQPIDPTKFTKTP